MYPRIVIGADGSADTAIAIELAGSIAARAGVPVTVVTVWDGFTNVPEPQSFEWARGVTEAAVAIVSAAGVTEVTSEEPTGIAADVLIRMATDDPEALFVVGGASLASPKDRVLGSIANRLSHHSPADVLFATHRLADGWSRVALTTDGSATSRQAVRRGLGLALAIGAEPHLVTVAKDEAEGERLMAASIGEIGIDDPELHPKQDILIGLLPAKALIDASSNYDLIAIGNRSMSGPSRLLGSVANKVTHGADTNLLLVNTSRD